MEIRLERSVKVYAYHVKATIAWAKERKDILPFLLRAEEKGYADAGDIDKHLFGGGRVAVAKRLLDICASYGLISRDLIVTEEGQKAIEEKQVFVPESGTWTFWISDDPLLPNPVLRIEAWEEPNAHDELIGNKGKKEKRGDFEKLPVYLVDFTGKKFQPSGGKGKFCRIDEFEGEKKGEIISPAANLTIRWVVEKEGSRLRLEGDIGENRTKVRTELEPPEIEFDKIWCALLQSEGVWKRWDTHQDVLRVHFEETKNDERTSMKRTLKVGSPKISDFGTFNAIHIPSVPLAALNHEDAEKWAHWRLLQNVRNYATSDRFMAWHQEAIEPFGGFSPRLPGRADLAMQIRSKRSDDERLKPSYWQLQAAEDWNL